MIRKAGMTQKGVLSEIEHACERTFSLSAARSTRMICQFEGLPAGRLDHSQRITSDFRPLWETAGKNVSLSPPQGQTAADSSNTFIAPMDWKYLWEYPSYEPASFRIKDNIGK